MVTVEERTARTWKLDGRSGVCARVAGDHDAGELGGAVKGG